jgi:hypothetical protein
LQFRLDQTDGNFRTAYVPSTQGNLELLIPHISDEPTNARDVKSSRTQAIAAANTNTSDAISHQADELLRFQMWWESGRGAKAASCVPILSLVDDMVLADIVRAGANYHAILSADRLDSLQRQVDRPASGAVALEPLRRALQSKGGAKSQARAVGSLLFKEARSIFEQVEAGTFTIDHKQTNTASTSSTSGCNTMNTKNSHHDVVSLDEVYDPPRHYICSDAFPDGAELAILAEPRQGSEMICSVARGTEFLARGRKGDYLQFKMEREVANGRVTCMAYVPQRIGQLELLVPAVQTPAVLCNQSSGFDSNASSDSRISALEHQVADQARTIFALQAELAALQKQMGAIAAAFGAASK